MRVPETGPVPLEEALADHTAVVFDLDGVLVDSNELKVDCVRDALAAFGPELVDPFVDEFRRTFGRTRREHFLAFHRDYLGGRNTGRDEDFEPFYARYAGDYAALLGERYAKAPLCAHADRLVPALAARGVPLYVATGTLTPEAERLLGWHGLLDAFRGVLGGEEPKARRLSGVVAGTGAAPHRTVLLGDSRQDLLAAGAAGTAFVLVTGYGFFPPGEILGGPSGPAGKEVAVAAGLDPRGLVTGAVVAQGPGQAGPVNAEPRSAP
ncbi:HAD family hydrolase [Streptomyces celluloflavus]|uniref:HAD family hydrolase n=1 Tax=Streptomyces celluloflavus TaxID=58344 RepID=UPI0036828DD4